MDGTPRPPDDLPPPPAAQPTDRWALDPGAIVPGRPGASLPLASEPVAPRRRGRTVLAAIVGAAVVVLVGGGAAAFFMLRGSSAALLQRVPADVDAIVVASLDPSAGQKVNVGRLAEAFPSVGGTDGVGERLEGWANDALEGVGVSYDDVTAWVGVEVALAVDVRDGQAQVAVLADVEDRDGAELMLAQLRAPGAAWADVSYTERMYQGTTVSIPNGTTEAPAYAFDDDVLILASHAELVERVIDTHLGTTQSLATAASFQETEAELPDGRLLIAFVNTASLQAELEDAVATEAAASIGGLGDLRAIEGVGMSMSAEPDGIVIDVVASYDAAALSGALREQVTATDHENVLLRSVPEDAWGVYGAQHLQFGIQEAVDELEANDAGLAADLRELGLTGGSGLLDVLTGDVAVALAPDEATTVGGALLVGVDDDDVASGAVERIASVALELAVSDVPRRSEDATAWRTETGPDGTPIAWLEGVPIAYAIRDGMLVIGSSVQQVDDVLGAEADGSLTEDPAYVRAIEGVLAGIDEASAADMVFYVDVGRVVASIEEALPAEERASFREDVGADLRRVRSVALGVDANETRQRARMFIAIDTGDEGS